MDYDSSSFNKFLISKNETHFRCLNWSWEPHKNAYVVDVCHCLADIRNIQQYEDVHKNEIFRVFEENKRYLYFKVTLKNYALMSQTKFLNTVTYHCLVHWVEAPIQDFLEVDDFRNLMFCCILNVRHGVCILYLGTAK